MFFEIWRDYGDVVYGGLWFDPDRDEFVEVIDLDSAAGVTGAALIEHGNAAIDEKAIRGGAAGMGLDKDEQPPARPVPMPHDWTPRPAPWPPAKPGHLFWVPDPAPLAGILKAWEWWEDFKGAGGEIKDLVGEERDVIGGLLRAAEATHVYRGKDGVNKRILVFQKGSNPSKDLSGVAEQWGATQWTTAENVGARVWKVLGKEFGIKKE